MSINFNNVKTDYYKVLGVSPISTFDEIHKSYRALSKKYHPDLAEDKTLAETKMKEIVAAYNQLKEPEQRKLYDSQRRFRARNFSKKNSNYTEPKLGFFAKLLTPKDKQPKPKKGLGGKDPVESSFLMTATLVQTKKTDSLEVAIEEFKALIPMDPKNPDIYYNIGVCYYYLGNYGEALSYFQKARELEPNNGDVIGMIELLS